MNVSLRKITPPSRRGISPHHASKTVDSKSAVKATNNTRGFAGLALGALSLTGVLLGTSEPVMASEVPVESVESVEAGRSCTLVVIDYFQAKEGETAEPHGVLVEKAAREVGFGNNLETVQISDTFSSLHDNYGGAFYKVANTADQDPKTTQKALDEYVSQTTSVFLTSNADQINGLSGYSHSALNLSMAFDKAKFVTAVDKLMRPAWDKSTVEPEKIEKAIRIARNLARAFDVDPEAVLSNDPAVAGPARHDLLQALIDQTSRAADRSTGVAAARVYWEEAVTHFESQHNSVVVGAGNSGRVQRQLTDEGGGLPLSFPADFETSFLENDQVTSVAAAELFTASNRPKPVELPARYGSTAEGVDFYAYGDVLDSKGDKHQGTSFAAPRGAATLAAIHCAFPDLNSNQAQEYLISELGRGMQPAPRPNEILLDLAQVDEIPGQMANYAP